MESTMTTDLQKVSPAADFAELKKLLGPPPVLSSEDANAYYAILARILKSLGASDFIEQIIAKDLADATWEMIRYSRHKALAVERQYREQREEEQEAEQPQGSTQESEKTGEPGEEDQQAEQVEPAADQTGATTTQFERMVVLAEVVDTVVDDCREI